MLPQNAIGQGEPIHIGQTVEKTREYFDIHLFTKHLMFENVCSTNQYVCTTDIFIVLESYF